ncbi:MAG: hypothetical protein C0506_09815 [Anaerolinea sp.]|nr:hypothetical protein [Anaerolinea sp.]
MHAWQRLVLVISVGLAAVLVTGCSDAKKDAAPADGAAREAGAGGGTQRSATFEILSSSIGVGVGTFTGAPVSTSIGAPAAGLTVRHSQSATVPADVAFVSVFVSPRGGFGPGGPQPVSPKDQADVVTALAALGIAKADITFDASLSYGPFAEVAVRLAVADLKTKGQPIADAIEKVLGRAQSSGARFGLAGCTAALDPLRKDGFKAAEEKAKALAAAGGLTLGQVVAVSEGTTPNIYGPAVADPCNPQQANVKNPASALPFDSPAEVKVSLDVAVTYALGSAGVSGGGITVLGTGSVTAKADEAYVVVFADLSGPTGPRPIAAKDRDALIAKLATLGIKAEDVKVESSSFGAPAVVSVDVDIAKLPKIGEDVLEAVGSVFGRNTQQQGVRFTHSACQAVASAAHKPALADAEARAKALAAVAGLKLGTLQSVSDGGGQLSVYGPAVDACSKEFTQLIYGSPFGSLLKPFDSPAAFTVNSALTATYSVAP